MSTVRIRAGGALRRVGAACGVQGCLCLNRACWEAAVVMGGLEQQVCSACAHLDVRRFAFLSPAATELWAGACQEHGAPQLHADKSQVPN